jgi:hypothetical protein
VTVHLHTKYVLNQLAPGITCVCGLIQRHVYLGTVGASSQLPCLIGLESKIHYCVAIYGHGNGQYGSRSVLIAITLCEVGRGKDLSSVHAI